MRRFWISPEDINNGEVEIEGELFHHIRDVCRFDQGSKFELLPGDGRALFVEVTSVAKKSLSAKILEERIIPPLPKPHIHLYVSVPKFATLETILEKAAELGVARVTPVFSDYSFVKTQDKIGENKWVRWEKIIKSASQQCGRGQLMGLEPAKKLSDVLKSFNPGTKVLGLFPYEGEAALTLKQHLNSLQGETYDQVALFVGSEGGFSEKEVELFGRHGLPALTLGDQILRVETACLALISVIKYHFEA